MVKALPFCLFTFLLLSACSEDDGVVEEYPDWQAKNEAYFTQKYQEYANAQSAVKFLLKKQTAVSSTTSTKADVPEDYILVDVIESADSWETESPHYTDSVACHIKGNLLPSVSYPQGYPFAYSYEGDFDDAVASPASYLVSGTVDGFSTALQHMRRGDHWRITIPYQLGFGTAGSGSAVPGYSTLIYEIRLVDFWFKTWGDRF